MPIMALMIFSYFSDLHHDTGMGFICVGNGILPLYRLLFDLDFLVSASENELFNRML